MQLDSALINRHRRNKMPVFFLDEKSTPEARSKRHQKSLRMMKGLSRKELEEEYGISASTEDKILASTSTNTSEPITFFFRKPENRAETINTLSGEGKDIGLFKKY
jgi:hypothetical protein